jgi:putative DNA primase/helicase
LIVIRYEESFENREDRELDSRLAAELPAILLWAMKGRQRLKVRGQFEVPAHLAEIKATLSREQSLEATFLRECCILDPDGKVPKLVFEHQYTSWAREMGEMPVGACLLAKRIYAAAYGKIASSRKTLDGRRAYFYVGVRLKD